MSTLFQGVQDRYNGITIDSQEEPCEPEKLSKALEESIAKWKEEKKRCVWFKIDIKDAAWVPILAKAEFNYHHARGDFLMMYKWLPTDSSSNLPPAVHTSIGVGGMVFNQKGQMLVVTELHFEIPHWKLPGGYVERGEDIKDAAIREVKEETGVDAEFESMITFRHTHNMMFGNSDIYFVVMLKATSEDINKSDLEIKDCKWMDVKEFLNHPEVIDFNRFLVQQALDLKKKNILLNLHKHTVKVAKWTREITALLVEDTNNSGI